MIVAIDHNILDLASDARALFHGDIEGAGVIIGRYEHSDGNLGYVLQRSKWRQVLAFCPVIGELLEAAGHLILQVVVHNLLRVLLETVLHTHLIQAAHLLSYAFARAHFLNFICKVRPVERDHSHLFVLQHLIGHALLISAAWVARLGSLEAWGEGNKLIEIIGVVVLHVRQAPEHLGRAHAVADIEQFFLSSRSLDHVDDCRVVIHSVLVPGEVPILIIFLRIHVLVISRVISTAIVANPNIVAFVSKLEHERCRVCVTTNPDGGISEASVLNEHRAFVWLHARFACPTKDMESSKDVVIRGSNLMSLPVVPEAGHSFSKAWIFAYHI